MSEAAAAAAPAPAGKGKKKLIIIIAAVLVLVAGGGGAFVMMSKKKAAAEEEAGGDGGHEAAPKAAAAHKADPAHPPTFVPLDPFTVNLADRDSDRYAQIGITLEFADAKLGDQVKVFMPAIRNNVLLAIADRSAGDLLGRDGKAKLARKVAIETSRALGFDVEDDEEAPEADAEDNGHQAVKKGGKKKKKRAPAALPVTGVHFSNFIIQ